MHEFGPLCKYFFRAPDFSDEVAVEFRKKVWSEEAVDQGPSSGKPAVFS
jgi:hypothetical protein